MTPPKPDLAEIRARHQRGCVESGGDDPLAPDDLRAMWEHIDRLERVANATQKAIDDHAIAMANDPDEQGRVQVLESYWVPVLEALEALREGSEHGG